MTDLKIEIIHFSSFSLELPVKCSILIMMGHARMLSLATITADIHDF